MPKVPLALLLALLALAGCGGDGSGTGGDEGTALVSTGETASEEGAEEGMREASNELAASDAADVLSARRTIDDACPTGTPGQVPDALLTEPVEVIATVTEQYPERIYETGNDARALEMKAIARQIGEQLRGCGATAGADRLEELGAE